MGKFKSIFKRFNWHTSATVNTATVTLFSVFLISVLGYGCSVTGGSINSAFFLYKGPCRTSTSINIALHLLLNIFSTLILASSSFFMQVVVAPSRADLDRAHRSHRWLDIGVSSIKNFRDMPKYRCLLWLGLLATSIPIHFFFNSTVFEVQPANSDFGLTVAAESFLLGNAEYHTPGVSLWNMHTPINCSMMLTTEVLYNCTRASHTAAGVLTYNPGFWQPNLLSLEDYLDINSEVNRNISRASQALQPGGWEMLDTRSCRAEFLACNKGTGLKDHTDVVLVVQDTPYGGKGMNLTTHWTRDDLYPDMNERDAAFWDRLYNRSSPNSLWFHAQCNMRQNFTSEAAKGCENPCVELLRGYAMYSYDDSEADYLGPRDEWQLSLGGISDLLEPQMRSGYNSSGDGALLDVKYCMARTVESQCQIGVSNTIVLIVTVCVCLKTLQCFFILRRLVWKSDREPLITPGDAIASLLQRPDPTTERMCIAGLSEFENVWTFHVVDKNPDGVVKRESVRRLRSAPTWTSDWFPEVEGRQWRAIRPLRVAAINRLTLIFSHIFFVVMLGLGVYFTYAATGGFKSISGEFGNSAVNQFVNLQMFKNSGSGVASGYSGTFLSSVMLANVPQFLLSISYFVFNNIFTRMHMAKEWADLSTDYRPLRVTLPKGDQVSTYTLQLPLRWSVPSILLSVILHWLVSNSLYVYISDGGFFSTSTGSATATDSSIGLSDAGFIGLGYSPTAIIAAVVLFLVMCTAPIVIALRQLPGNIPVVGTNSLAISAACHASTLSKVVRSDESSGSDAEKGPFLTVTETISPTTPGSADRLNSEVDWEESRKSLAVFERLAQRKIKWGVVDMPKEYFDGVHMDECGEVGHLSFGVEEDDVQPPVDGRWYI
ncbi:hypothetical protein B0H66DRAFT_559574 [Apodospora peruviana]|uniref:DUF6536 domain-containing protein n=1 Tax=Apodospora peruviana TaxID=516989 RepID=A0AAE0HZI1_9PEZI|nr:hypothetical protein B0H66DRAFT_559574 [Apodospora peruviana]